MKPELYAKTTGAGGSIIDILEVVESDVASNLAKEEQQESEAQVEYDKLMQENAVTKTFKDQDVKYKTQEASNLDKAISDLTADLASSEKRLTMTQCTCTVDGSRIRIEEKGMICHTVKLMA